MVIIDSIIRLLPNVLGNDESAMDESFQRDLLEYPQYTRPVSFEGKEVPKVLVSGNHANIAKWRKYMSLKETYENRPDLLAKAFLTEEEKYLLEQIKKGVEIF